MWTQQRVLYHSQLSPLVNVKLLDPRECVAAAVAAYDCGHAPLNAVEGFVRQFIGWREFIRGVYWHEGPDYPSRNTLDADGRLPEFYWTADTDLACLQDCLKSVVDLAWGHHIPRLMVIGNFAMLAGVHAREVADWFLAMYADAVDWASNPNTIGMSQHADGGVVGTKPYAGAANYISKMSNYCESCRYDPKARHGDIDSPRPPCPFNSLYWDFLRRHQKRFKNNQRMAMVMKGLERMQPQELHQITITAGAYRERFGVTATPPNRRHRDANRPEPAAE
jgi:deoxyribodipyrimidine photolyase-related protein